MIRCRLSTLLGEQKLTRSEVARETGLQKQTLSGLYYDTARRIDLESVEKLCRYLKVEVGDLFVLVDANAPPPRPAPTRKKKAA